jgi:hypothetical protein
MKVYRAVVLLSIEFVYLLHQPVHVLEHTVFPHYGASSRSSSQEWLILFGVRGTLLFLAVVFCLLLVSIDRVGEYH